MAYNEEVLVKVHLLDKGSALDGFASSSFTAGSDPSPPPLSSGNEAPSADADGPYTVSEDSTVVLDGSGSSDSDGSIESYEWKIIEDPTGEATLKNADSVMPMFVAPTTIDAENTEVIVSLTVTDDDGKTGSDSATVVISGALSGSENTGSWLGGYSREVGEKQDMKPNRPFPTPDPREVEGIPIWVLGIVMIVSGVMMVVSWEGKDRETPDNMFGGTEKSWDFGKGEKALMVIGTVLLVLTYLFIGIGVTSVVYTIAFIVSFSRTVASPITLPVY